MDEKDCLGLDIAFLGISSSEQSELPTEGAISATIEILGNCPIKIDGSDLIVYPADGVYCLFESSGCCLEMVRNMRFEWLTEGIATPVLNARFKKTFKALKKEK